MLEPEPAEPAEPVEQPTDDAAPKNPKTRKPKERRPKKEYTGELSQTMIFVSNLPYKVKDDDLKDIFKDFAVVSAHVVCLRNGMSKGFGFVEVVSHEEQTRLLRDYDKIVVDERELVVKPAQATQTKPEDKPVEAV